MNSLNIIFCCYFCYYFSLIRLGFNWTELDSFPKLCLLTFDRILNEPEALKVAVPLEQCFQFSTCNFDNMQTNLNDNKRFLLCNELAFD